MPSPLSDRPLIWIDTETTGLDPTQHDIIEFAGIRDDTDETLHLKIWPERPENAHPKALAVNGYTPEAWEAAGAVKMKDAIGKIGAFLQDSVLGGQNVGFDEGFLREAFRTHKVPNRIGYHKLDTVTMALVHLRPLGIPSVSLHTICEVLGISNDGEHTALADVRRTRAVYRALINPSEKALAYWKERIEAMRAKG